MTFIPVDTEPHDIQGKYAMKLEITKLIDWLPEKHTCDLSRDCACDDTPYVL